MIDNEMHFISSEESYDAIISVLKEIACDLAFHFEKEGKEYDPRITIIQFDILLQYSLLEFIMSDYYFGSDELRFIRGIAKQGDFIQYLNSVTQSEYTWEDFYVSNVMQIRSFLQNIRNSIDSLGAEVVGIFAFYKKNNPEKATYLIRLIDIFVNRIVQILENLANISGIKKNKLNTELLLCHYCNMIAYIGMNDISSLL